MISSGNISTSNRNDFGLSRKRTVSAAGRMVKEGDKSYTYGYLDKVLAVRENDKKIASFDYQVDGQITQAIHGDKVENFLWDNLALVHRGETTYINEPYVTGRNPILSSKDGVMFNDMLGSTLNIGGKTIHMTAFGETKDTDALFTGKPYIGELGYAFLFRNYRADQGKWQTSDPLGYPDGWNNLAYCKNDFINSYDFLGLEWEWVSTKSKTDYYIWGPNESGPYLSRTAAQSVVDSKISTLKVNIINGLKSNLSPKEILVMDNWTISFNISETPAGEFYITGHLSISFTYSIWRKKEE